MPTWDSDQYLIFADERTRPAVDLAARVSLEAPRRIIDLGCGPGNSTAVLARRWPTAELTGLDNCAEMLDAARRDFPTWTWLDGDIAAWSADAPFDVVFSNAALQWVPDHGWLLPRLLDQVGPDGALAIQMPANSEAPPHRLMRELAFSTAWRGHFEVPPRDWHIHEAAFYYDLLSPHAQRIDLWTTEYVHILPNPDGLIDWYRGTGLRPWLDALPDEPTRARFIAEYRAAIAPHYPPRPDGRVLFPFRRLFMIAYR